MNAQEIRKAHGEWVALEWKHNRPVTVEQLRASSGFCEFLCALAQVQEQPWPSLDDLKTEGIVNADA